jgi:hypothetical protein
MRRIILLVGLALLMATFVVLSALLALAAAESIDVVCRAPNGDFYGLNGGDTLNGQGGNDYIECGVGNDVCRGNAGNDQVWGGPGGSASDPELLLGNDGNDYVNGGFGSDALSGGDGSDLLDSVDGIAGNDSISTGANPNDVCIVDSDGTERTLPSIATPFTQPSTNP